MNRIMIYNEVELAKLFAFIRAGARGIRFELVGVSADRALSRLERWAKENDVRVGVRIVTPNTERMAMLGVGGAAVGAGFGVVVGGVGGALLGAGLGAIAGVALAHVEIEVRTNGLDSARGTVFTLA